MDFSHCQISGHLKKKKKKYVKLEWSYFIWEQSDTSHSGLFLAISINLFVKLDWLHMHASAGESLPPPIEQLT